MLWKLLNSCVSIGRTVPLINIYLYRFLIFELELKQFLEFKLILSEENGNKGEKTGKSNKN